MKNNFLSLIIVVLLLAVTTSCSGFLSGNLDFYYNQQQKPVVDDIPYVPEAGGVTGKFGVMFEILGPHGVINQEKLEQYMTDNKDVLENDLDATTKFFTQLLQLPIVQKDKDSSMNFFTLTEFKAFDFSNQLIIAKFNDKNVPSMEYVASNENTLWIREEADEGKYLVDPDGKADINKFYYVGENTMAGQFPIINVSYYKYEGMNPFYSYKDDIVDGSPQPSYNTKTYERIIDDSGNTVTETFLQRFFFYRFVGKGGGVADLDNILVAVDTYTGLIFACGIPTEFKSLLGQDNPTKWEAVETLLANDGKEYRFFEYDPAGYVANDGTFVMYDWYNENLAKANASNQEYFKPQFTGISPYLIDLEIKTPKISRIISDRDAEGFYTEIAEITFPDAPTKIAYYDVYRIDDASSEKVHLGTVASSGKPSGDYKSTATIKDYDALVLRSKPKYIVEAKNADGVLIQTSSPIEGERDLTDEELQNIAIEVMRNALIDQGLHDLGFPASEGEDIKTIITTNNGIFKHIRNYTKKKIGFLKYDYIFDHSYTVTDYDTALVTIDGCINYKNSKDLWSFNSIDTVSGNDVHNEPFTGVVTATSPFGSDVVITFNDITIGNDDKNNPMWQDGTLEITIGTNAPVIYTTDDILFPFYMDSATFLATILDENGKYSQE